MPVLAAWGTTQWILVIIAVIILIVLIVMWSTRKAAPEDTEGGLGLEQEKAPEEEPEEAEPGAEQ